MTIKGWIRGTAIPSGLAALLILTPARSCRASDAAPAGISVSPTRVVFENGKDNAQVTVMNQGVEPSLCRITLIRMRMTETGSIQEVEDSIAGEAFADTLIRFSPREVRLMPRESQVIRLKLVKTANLPDGEFRSHLLIRQVPPIDSPPVDESEASGGQQGIRLTPVFGTAIPVIVRHGSVTASISIVKVGIDGGETSHPTLRLAMNRVGNRSVYGDLSVSVLSNRGSLPIGQIRGIAVYAPNATRIVELPLNLEDGGAQEPKRLLVTFAEAGGKDALVSRAEVDLP